MGDKKFIVAIDGTSGAGKSTVAKALAKMLGYKYVNTGGIYRSIAYKVMMKDIKDNDKIIEIARNTKIDFEVVDGDSRIIVDGVDITDEIFSPKIIDLTSKISAIPEVREALLGIQRKLGESGGIVLEGRDIGTNVFPNAEWKFFLDAEEWKRAERVNKVMDEEGKRKYATKEALMQLIKEIDHRDKNREVAPLKMAEDAIYYNNTHSPTAERDASILWYYVKHKEDIVKNSGKLKNKE